MLEKSGYRALHYVLKIGNRKEAIDFLRDGLGMKVLRHEEFEKGCEATCNGPYDGKWSKTMVGFGPEDDHFVLELTYNYGISSYRHGNALFAIEIGKQDIFRLVELGAKIEKQKSGVTGSDSTTDVYVIYNNGYRFEIRHNPKGDEISRVILARGLIEAKSPQIVDIFYSSLLGMKASSPQSTPALIREFTYGPNQAVLSIKDLGDSKVDHATAFGRTAFSCPTGELPEIQKDVTNATEIKGTILTPLISLDTPGKATVSVVIVADPWGHEICFVGDEGFRELSKVDSNADSALNNKIAEDKSDEWFAKRGKTKATS